MTSLIRTIGRQYRFDYPAEFRTLPDYTVHTGQTVTVVRQLTAQEADFPSEDCPDPMYEVAALDGWTGHAWGSELKEINS